MYTYVSSELCAYMYTTMNTYMVETIKTEIEKLTPNVQ